MKQLILGVLLLISFSAFSQNVVIFQNGNLGSSTVITDPLKTRVDSCSTAIQGIGGGSGGAVTTGTPNTVRYFNADGRDSSSNLYYNGNNFIIPFDFSNNALNSVFNFNPGGSTSFKVSGSGSDNLIELHTPTAYIDGGDLSHTAKFGINTTTPNAALDVVGDVKIRGLIDIYDVAGGYSKINTSGRVGIGDLNGTTNISVRGTLDEDIIFYSSNQGHVFTGNVGVNTGAAPTVALDLVGEMNITGNITGNNKAIFKSGSFGENSFVGTESQFSAGFNNSSSLSDGAIAIGHSNVSIGRGGVALGYNTSVKGNGSVAVGIYNDDTETFNTVSRLFQIGNGNYNTGARSNLLTATMEGIGINTLTPNAALDVVGNIQNTGTIQTGGYTVSTLPTGTTGMMAYVTDAITPTYLAVVVGSGAIFCPVIFDGTNWISH